MDTDYQNKHYNINQKDEETQDDRGRDGGTNFILRIKEQETCLTLQEHDDGDDFYVYVFLLLFMFRSRYSVHYVVLCIVCKCVLYYCHRVSIQLQLINISYHKRCVEVVYKKFKFHHTFLVCQCMYSPRQLHVRNMCLSSEWIKEKIFTQLLLGLRSQCFTYVLYKYLHINLDIPGK